MFIANDILESTRAIHNDLSDAENSVFIYSLFDVQTAGMG